MVQTYRTVKCGFQGRINPCKELQNAAAWRAAATKSNIAQLGKEFP